MGFRAVGGALPGPRDVSGHTRLSPKKDSTPGGEVQSRERTVAVPKEGQYAPPDWHCESKCPPA